MPTYKTKNAVTPLYNIKGKVHGEVIKGMGTQVEVTGAMRDIPTRGACWRLVNPSNAFIKISDLTSIQPPPPPPPPSSGKAELWKMLRSSNPDPLATATEKGVGTPDIIVFNTGDGRTQFTRLWQLYLVALNPNMRLQHVAAIMGSGRWGFNKTGLPTPRFPQKRANYIMNEDLEYPYPETDKDRTTTYSVHRGIQVGNEVILETLDGNEPPPPIEEVNPRTHPHLFFHLTIVYPEEKSISPFPNGAPAWGYQGNFTWFPLVSVNEIRVPLSKVRRVDEYTLPYKPQRV